MTRTLAELVEAGNNPQKYIGMWCDNLASAAKEPSLVVLACAQGDLCWVLHTGLNGQWSCFSLGGVAPRPDLMRAWNPDGTPVVMRQEWGLAYSTSYDNFQEHEIYLIGDDEDKTRRNLDKLRELETTRDSVRDVQLHRRHVSEWEATDG